MLWTSSELKASVSLAWPSCISRGVETGCASLDSWYSDSRHCKLHRNTEAPSRKTTPVNSIEACLDVTPGSFSATLRIFVANESKHRMAATLLSIRIETHDPSQRRLAGVVYHPEEPFRRTHDPSGCLTSSNVLTLNFTDSCHRSALFLDAALSDNLTLSLIATAFRQEKPRLAPLGHAILRKRITPESAGE